MRGTDSNMGNADETCLTEMDGQIGYVWCCLVEKKKTLNYLNYLGFNLKILRERQCIELILHFQLTPFLIMLV